MKILLYGQSNSVATDEPEYREPRRFLGLTWIGWLNFLIVQWLFLRLFWVQGFDGSRQKIGIRFAVPFGKHGILLPRLGGYISTADHAARVMTAIVNSLSAAAVVVGADPNDVAAWQDDTLSHARDPLGPTAWPAYRKLIAPPGSAYARDDEAR